MSTAIQQGPTRRALLAGTLAVCGLMAGCGSSAPSTGGTDPNPAPEEFGLSEAELTARIEATEGLIAACMSDSGFDYIALDAVTIMQAMSNDKSAPGVSSDEYVRQFGLGITTQVDQPIVTFGAGPENARYVEGLPSADQVAFERFLWGESTDWNHARAVEAEDFSQTDGCTRSSAEQTYTGTELSGAYVNPSDVLLEQDPRMIAAVGQWADCMRAGGYEYDNPDQVDEDLQERLDAITEGQDPATLTGPALDSLHQLQGEELAIAAKLTTCEDEHIAPVQQTIESELYGAPQP